MAAVAIIMKMSYLQKYEWINWTLNEWTCVWGAQPLFLGIHCYRHRHRHHNSFIPYVWLCEVKLLKKCMHESHKSYCCCGGNLSDNKKMQQQCVRFLCTEWSLFCWWWFVSEFLQGDAEKIKCVAVWRWEIL